MAQTGTHAIRNSDVVLLDALVARAGVALACHYANSDEYEAEIVAARREAGLYGRTWPHQMEIWAGLIAGTAIVVLAILA
jgi:hypothetical protein